MRNRSNRRVRESDAARKIPGIAPVFSGCETARSIGKKIKRPRAAWRFKICRYAKRKTNGYARDMTSICRVDCLTKNVK